MFWFLCHHFLRTAWSCWNARGKMSTPHLYLFLRSTLSDACLTSDQSLCSERDECEVFSERFIIHMKNSGLCINPERCWLSKEKCLFKRVIQAKFGPLLIWHNCLVQEWITWENLLPWNSTGTTTIGLKHSIRNSNNLHYWHINYKKSLRQIVSMLYLINTTTYLVSRKQYHRPTCLCHRSLRLSLTWYDVAKEKKQRNNES